MMNRTDIQTEAPVANSAKETPIDLMYPLAIAAFDWAQKRKESIDNRIQTQLSFMAGFIFVIALLIRKRLPEATFHSTWFIVAMSFFVAAVVFGTIARFSGYLKLFNVKTMYDKAKAMSVDDFKKEVIERSGVGLTLNRAALLRKRWWNILMLISFAIGYGLLFLWLFRAV